MMDVLIGREQEIARLDQCMREERPQLVIVYGRRRVGKTYLINKYFEGRFDFKLTGMFDTKKEIQLHNFAVELSRHTKSPVTSPKNWIEAFELLRNYLGSLPEDEKHVVFFDEMPWLDTQKSDFLPAFEFFWNDYGCTLKNLVMIVCGSATSWMDRKLGKNKGGLFNRQTCSLFLMPFTLKETEEFLKSRNIMWSRYEIAECYMVMGGIPYYLSLLIPNLSLAGNIDNLFFRKRAELWDEFDNLYNTLFSNSALYIRIVETLSRKRGGMTRSDLAADASISDNSVLSEALSDLKASGFIREYSYYGNKKRYNMYQLADYYSLFYFKFIKDYPGRDEHFWTHMVDNPSRRAWAGLTFEQLCKDHIGQIKRKLGIAGVMSEESTWFVRADSKDGDSVKGAQIDLIIDRRDQTLNICEIKFALDEYEIDKEYDRSLRNKIDVFVRTTGCRKSIQLTMITTYGIKQNKYSSKVSNQVVLDDLFA